MRKKPGTLQRHVATNAFEASVLVECYELASARTTRDAYWGDFRQWIRFCHERGVDPTDPIKGAVVAWVEVMKDQKLAPKTIVRRMSALSSLYRRLRKTEPPLVTKNPFSIEDGPKRDRAQPVEPTPIAEPEQIKKLLETCDDSILGIRDQAIIRVLWGTGIRRASLVSMTFERIRRDRQDHLATVIGKGGKSLRLLIRGRAGAALTRWLEVLRDAGLTTGPIWRTKRGPMTERAIGHMLDRRARAGGVKSLSPHTFRVAFLTYNPAGLDAKQDAAGHADPATTKLYDRASWRGREAFERMPELEDMEED